MSKSTFIGKQIVCKHAFIIVLLYFISSLSIATAQSTQKIKITGKVTTKADGLPFPGVTIIDKDNPSTGVVTDFDGNYEISIAGNTLLFSYVGFKTQEVPVNDNRVIDIAMEEDIATLDDVVVVGYGVQKKVTVTGAVVAVAGENLEASPAINLSNSLAGRLPGVTIIQSTGEPGFDGSSINIRGTNTIGNNNPLVVIDGIPDREGGLERLNPQDIESMSVLKDASAAIYGARAANGVILITTKRGKSGKPTITYDSNIGFNQPTRVPEMANAVEYANIMNDIGIYQSNVPVNDWQNASNSLQTIGTYTFPTATGEETITANFSPEDIRLYANGSDPWGHPDTDWFGDVFKKWAAQSQHNLQITGGNENVNYMSSLGYLNQDAYYKNSATRYQQYNFRINLDAKVNDYIKTSLGVLVRREEREFPTQSADDIFRMLMRGRPTEPAIWLNGKPGPAIENGQNPVVITTNATGYDRSPTDYVQTNATIEITNPWIQGLKLTLMGSVDQKNIKSKKWETPWELYSWDGVSYEPDGVTPLLEASVQSPFTDARLRQSSETTLNTNLTAMLNYDRTFGEHTFNLLAGVTRETFSGDDFFAFRRNFLSTAVDQLAVGGTEDQNTGGTAYRRSRLGYYGRFQYNYKEKYLLEFIGRYDGSYIFPGADRFGFFPGGLLGWNISNEDFFDVDFINYLKVRASYGQMGNDQIIFNDELVEYAFLAAYGFSEYPISDAVVTTLQETILANPSFTWERANNFNIGLDTRVLNNTLEATLEYFYNRRDQILIRQLGSTPATSGIGDLLPPVNAGKLDNRGFEFSLAYYGGKETGLKYTIGINGGYAKNEVVFKDEIPGAPEYQREEGKPIDGYLVYEYDGVFRDTEEIASNTIDYSGVTGQLRPGDMKFKDINGDGKIDADDQIRIDDNGTPTFNFGANIDLNYKNFDLTVLFQGATGASIRIQTESGDIGNYLKYSHDNRWSIDNPSSVHPRLASRGDTYYTGGNFGDNTYFLFSKDYIRLKNIQLGYNFPSAMIKGLGLSRLRLYISALNLFTIDKYKIFDPEVTRGDGWNYPQARVINTGFSITF